MKSDEELIEILKEINVSMVNIFKLSTSTGFKKNSKSEVAISERQFHILYAMNKRNINTTSTLAEFFDLSKANISIIVSKLEASGHITKDQNKENSDGRNVFFQITEKGLEDLEKHKQLVISNANDHFLYLLTDQEKLELLQIAIKLSGLVKVKFDFNDSFESMAILMMSLRKYLNTVLDKSVINSKLDISNNDFLLLHMMSVSNNSLENISVATGISNSALSTQINSLLDRGYVYKEIDKKDKRKKYFYLCEEKLPLIDQIIDEQIKILIEDIKNTTKEEQETILEIIVGFRYIMNKSVESLKNISK